MSPNQANTKRYEDFLKMDQILGTCCNKTNDNYNNTSLNKLITLVQVFTFICKHGIYKTSEY